MSEAMLVERVSVQGREAVLFGRKVEKDLADDAVQAWAVLEALRQDFNRHYASCMSSSDNADVALARQFFDEHVKPKADVYLAIVGNEVSVKVPADRLNGTAPGTLYKF